MTVTNLIEQLKVELITITGMILKETDEIQLEKLHAIRRFVSSHLTSLKQIKGL